MEEKTYTEAWRQEREAKWSKIVFGLEFDIQHLRDLNRRLIQENLSLREILEGKKAAH